MTYQRIISRIMNSSNIRLTYLILIVLLSNLVANAQTVSWTTDATQACDTATAQDPTSITTYKGSIYFIYVNPQRQMVVAKKTGNKIQRSVVFNIEMPWFEKWHICPTIGVDKKGYIHICGDMHNDKWKYFRSDKPENITSWTRRNDLPGNGITYPTIFYDKNREMFLCFRHESNVAGKGNHRGGIIRYNADKDTFVMLGGNNYDDITGYAPKIPPLGSKPTTMIWGNGFGGNGCWYTKTGIRLFFDKKNRMHLVATVINECLGANLGHQSNTHIIYAYSDDLGQIWHQAGGATITTLPLTVINASIVLDRTTQHDIYGGECEIGAFDSEHPVVSYKLSSDNSSHSVMWTGSVWKKIDPPHSTNIMMSRENGYTVWYNGTYIDYTKDGITWKSLTGSPEFPKGACGSQGGIDREYFKQTGNFRYHGKFENFSKSAIFTINSNIKL